MLTIAIRLTGNGHKAVNIQSPDSPHHPFAVPARIPCNLYL